MSICKVTNDHSQNIWSHSKYIEHNQKIFEPSDASGIVRKWIPIWTLNKCPLCISWFFWDTLLVKLHYYCNTWYVLLFWGVFNGKLKFTIKDPPKKVIRVTYCNSSAILLIKCLKKIRKYIVDTCLEFKYSLANNVLLVISPNVIFFYFR